LQPGRDRRKCFITCPSTRTAPGWSKIPRPLPRGEQHLKQPSELIEEAEKSEEYEESSSEDEPPPDIPQQSQSPEQEFPEEEPPVNPEHQLQIEEFYLKSESSSKEEQEPSTAQHLNKSQQVPDIEQIEEPEPDPNLEPREETKPEMSDRETPAVESKSRPKWPAPHIYTGKEKNRDP
jgi:hypothetical protein